MLGRTISHYRILDKLGEGGMGVVYKAEDAKLERTVALKFLAAHLLNDDEAKQRFLREAKAAAALNHPNICSVYEIDETDGKTFISMAYVEGETLEERIARGPLPIKEALDIGQQIAKGLEGAHEKGIVHRDIKPANILVAQDGQVTIMDFGLARLTEASRLTKADTTVGTVAYMSPEQAQGGEVDHRSDLWALGCAIYEMIAGARPFKGAYDQALLYEIVQQEPEPLTGVRAGVPMELEFIVGKCLAKDASDRYQSAKEIAVDLRTLAEKMKSGRSTILRTAEMGVGLPANPATVAHVSRFDPPPRDALIVKRSRLSGPHSPHFWDVEKTGGGALSDLGCHCIEAARYFFGKDDPVVNVMAWGATLVHHDKTKGEDNALLVLEFASGGIAHCELSWTTKGGLDLRNEIHGSEGSIFTDVTRGTPIRAFVSSSAGYVIEKADADVGWIQPLPEEAFTYGYQAEMRHFVECVRDGVEPRETYHDGFVVNAILDAGYDSMKRRRWVKPKC